jgi:hypothetical protein
MNPENHIQHDEVGSVKSIEDTLIHGGIHLFIIFLPLICFLMLFVFAWDKYRGGDEY